LVVSSVSSAALFLGCRKGKDLEPTPRNEAHAAPVGALEAGTESEPEVGAVEDLMREHGVIRRALVVYREAAARLRSESSAVPLDALEKTARLLRRFAEDYHETKLEEAHIFPAVKRAGGEASRDIDTLVAQHRRGREITDYVLAIASKPMSPASAQP